MFARCGLVLGKENGKWLKRQVLGYSSHKIICGRCDRRGQKKTSSVVDARLRRWTSFWPQKRAETLGADYGGCERGLFRRSSLQSARTFHWLPSLSLAVHRQKVRSSFAPPLRSCELVPLHSKGEKNESKRQQERRLHDCIAHTPVHPYIDI